MISEITDKGFRQRKTMAYPGSRGSLRGKTNETRLSFISPRKEPLEPG
jgi:hypothetical protein